jgi:hypothetical protein
MSAAPPHPTPPPPPSPHMTTGPDRQIVIVSHSNLFYWWPVWAIGFVLFLLTYFDGHRMAIVPHGTKSIEKEDFYLPDEGVPQKGKVMSRGLLVFPQGNTIPPDRTDPTKLQDPYLRASLHKSYGVLWTTVLMLVIVITNVPLRGMWSFVVIMLVILFSIIFALAGWWETILHTLDLLDIRINAGGYLFVSLILFFIWLVTMLFFDRQIYMVFTPGQFKVRTEIGGGEQVYDAVGMTLQKQRSDLFRHWILGLGSGDLIVKTSGAQAHQFEMDNVLFITKKVQQIEEMLKRKTVIEAK